MRKEDLGYDYIEFTKVSGYLDHLAHTTSVFSEVDADSARITENVSNLVSRTKGANNLGREISRWIVMRNRAANFFYATRDYEEADNVFFAAKNNIFVYEIHARLRLRELTKQLRQKLPRHIFLTTANTPSEEAKFLDGVGGTWEEFSIAVDLIPHLKPFFRGRQTISILELLTLLSEIVKKTQDKKSYVISPEFFTDLARAYAELCNKNPGHLARGKVDLSEFFINYSWSNERAYDDELKLQNGGNTTYAVINLMDAFIDDFYQALNDLDDPRHPAARNLTDAYLYSEDGESNNDNFILRLAAGLKVREGKQLLNQVDWLKNLREISDEEDTWYGQLFTAILDTLGKSDLRAYWAADLPPFIDQNPKNFAIDDEQCQLSSEAIQFFRNAEVPYIRISLNTKDLSRKTLSSVDLVKVFCKGENGLVSGRVEFFKNDEGIDPDQIVEFNGEAFIGVAFRSFRFLFNSTDENPAVMWSILDPDSITPEYEALLLEIISKAISKRILLDKTKELEFDEDLSEEATETPVDELRPITSADIYTSPAKGPQYQPRKNTKRTKDFPRLATDINDQMSADETLRVLNPIFICDDEVLAKAAKKFSPVEYKLIVNKLVHQAKGTSKIKTLLSLGSLRYSHLEGPNPNLRVISLRVTKHIRILAQPTLGTNSAQVYAIVRRHEIK